MKKNKSFLVSVKSRDQLIADDREHVVLAKTRRTRIIASVSDKTNSYEKLRDMVMAGVNGFNYNTAYLRSKNAMEKLVKIRDRLEKELEIYLPINIMLKGRQVRIGSLREPEIFLLKGSTIRITADARVLGDQNIICIDNEQFLNQVRINDKIVCDYGQVVFIVTAKSDSLEAANILMTEHPNLYPTVESFRRRANDSNSNTDTDGSQKKSQAKSKSNFSDASPDPLEQLTHQHSRSEANSPIHKSSTARKAKYSEAVKKKKELKQKTKYQVLNCIVQQDCILKPLRPVFILNENNWVDNAESDEEQKPKIIKKTKQSYSNLAQLSKEMILEQQEDNDDDSEPEESQITQEDIVHLKNAKKYGFDSVTVSNIQKVNEIKDLQSVMGKNCRMKILIRITNKEGVQNFEQLIKEADGCIIARGYISAQSAIESVMQQQYNMIKISHRSLKPVNIKIINFVVKVIIASQILESMITSLLPTFSELGDISNLINEDIDALMLTGETTYGKYVTQTVQTLDRVCRQVEQNQILFRIHHIEERTDYLKQIVSVKHRVSGSVIAATIDAAYRIKAKLIIAFTSSGSTVIKLSKFKPVCSIISVTSSVEIARQLQLIGGVTSLCFGTLIGTEQLSKKVIEYAKRKKFIEPGDYVIMISGQVENLSGSINTMKIFQVQ